jgi:hypothetical protein
LKGFNLPWLEEHDHEHFEFQNSDDLDGMPVLLNDDHDDEHESEEDE